MKKLIKLIITHKNKVVLLAYLVVVLFETFLGPFRTYSEIRKYNLIPFATISEILSYSSAIFVIFINIFANVAIFIPFGFLIPLSFKDIRNVGILILITLIVILLIEIFQYIFNVGVFDIDDILLNTLGSLIGYLLFRTSKKINLHRTMI